MIHAVDFTISAPDNFADLTNPFTIHLEKWSDGKFELEEEIGLSGTSFPAVVKLAVTQLYRLTVSEVLPGGITVTRSADNIDLGFIGQYIFLFFFFLNKKTPLHCFAIHLS